MSLTAQKYLVAALSVALFGALLAAGRMEARREAAVARQRPGLTAASLNPQLARGRKLFITYSCNACHGAEGRGGIRNINAESGGEINGLLHVSETYTSEELEKKIREGVPTVGKAESTGPEPPLKMPAYQDLIAGQELKDLVAYVLSLAPSEKRVPVNW